MVSPMLSDNIRTMAGIQLKGDSWEFIDCEGVQHITEPTKLSEVGTASLKNKKKREQKKKKLEQSRHAMSSNKVTFGTVEEILFTREISYDAIPSKGAYPLGLGDLESRGNIQPVDAYCAEQQQNLRHRSASFESSTSSSVSGDTAVASTRSDSIDADSEVFESRQYDYKQGRRNLLFEPTSEEERLVILGSFISASGMRKAQINHENETPPHSTSIHAHPIADLNRDVRNIRATRDSTGCSCKALKVDKMSIIKMKAELSAHGHLVGICGKDSIEKLSKTELTSTVKDVLKLCLLCTANNCECVQLGIPCSAEVRTQPLHYSCSVMSSTNSLLISP